MYTLNLEQEILCALRIRHRRGCECSDGATTAHLATMLEREPSEVTEALRRMSASGHVRFDGKRWRENRREKQTVS